MKALVVLGGWLLMAGIALAQSAAILGNVEIASDSDGFHATRLRAGALYSYSSHLEYAGVAAQHTEYRQAGWRRGVTGVVGLWRKQELATLSGVNAEAGLVEVAGRTRVIGDATWGARIDATTGVELIAAADLVDTRPALERGIAYGLFAGSIEQRLLERLTLIGLAGYQPFTDGNARVHARARVVFDALPEQGVNLQLRWRGYESRQSDVQGAYFNPSHYQQWTGVVGFRKRHAGWVWQGALGAGREIVDNTNSQPVQLAELRAEGPLAGKLRIALNASYNKSTGYVDAPNYSYRRVGATLTYPF
ncbi:MAG: hypothetical protein ABJC33_07185 [Betaproteobacteria bacterium]